MLLRSHVAQVRAASAAPMRRPLATHTFFAEPPPGNEEENGSASSASEFGRPPGSRGACLVKISVARSAYAEAPFSFSFTGRDSSFANARLHVP